MIEHAKHKGLANGCCPDMSRSQRTKRWDFNFENMEWRSSFGLLEDDVSSALQQNVVNDIHAILRTLNFSQQDRLHDSGVGHQE